MKPKPKNNKPKQARKTEGSSDVMPISQLMDLFQQLNELASWWLSPAAIHQLKSGLTGEFINKINKAPALPTAPGSCTILLVNKGGRHSKILRKAFGLPVRWINSAESEITYKPNHLPEKLHKLAEKVKYELGIQDTQSINWRLQLAIQGQVPEHFQLSFESAFIPLAASLHLAKEQAACNPTILSTGAWDPKSGVQSIEGVEAKLSEAKRLGATKLFVPTENKVEADLVAEGIKVVGLEIEARSRGNLKLVLDTLLGEGGLDRRPELTASLELRSKWLTRSLKRKDPLFAQHYGDLVLKELAEKISANARKAGEQVPSGGTLVLSITGETAVTLLSLELFKPKKVLALCTKDPEGERFKEELKKHLDRLGNTLDLEIVEHNGTYQEALRGLQSIAGARLLEPVICDMQGGRKDFSFAIASWAKSLKCQSSSWLVPAQHVDRSPQVNTETLVRV